MKFEPVVKKRIVKLDWRSWDLTAPEPKLCPPGGEAENYIIRRRHDPAISDALGPLYLARLEPLARLKTLPPDFGLTPENIADVLEHPAPLLLESIPPGDVFGDALGLSCFCRARAARWLAEHAGDYLRFWVQPLA